MNENQEREMMEYIRTITDRIPTETHMTYIIDDMADFCQKINKKFKIFTKNEN